MWQLNKETNAISKYLWTHIWREKLLLRYRSCPSWQFNEVASVRITFEFTVAGHDDSICQGILHLHFRLVKKGLKKVSYRRERILKLFFGILDLKSDMLDGLACYLPVVLASTTEPPTTLPQLAVWDLNRCHDHYYLFLKIFFWRIIRWVQTNCIINK